MAKFAPFVLIVQLTQLYFKLAGCSLPPLCMFIEFDQFVIL